MRCRWLHLCHRMSWWFYRPSLNQAIILFWRILYRKYRLPLLFHRKGVRACSLQFFADMGHVEEQKWYFSKVAVKGASHKKTTKAYG